jgi:hypothetical protein
VRVDGIQPLDVGPAALGALLVAGLDESGHGFLLR